MTDKGKLRRAAALALARRAAAAAFSSIGWPAIIAVALIGICFVTLAILVVVISISQVSAKRDAMNYQCESRLGYSVGNTASLLVPPPGTATGVATSQPPVTITALQPATTSMPTTTTTTSTTTTATTSPLPTSNPYATMTMPTGLNAHDAACATAVKKGPLIGPPLTSRGTQLGVDAAAAALEHIGLSATETDGSVAGPTNNAFSPANLTRYAYFKASAGTLILPETLSEQITFGDRVDPGHVSPGDLVFYNFTATDGPVSVMIATTSSEGIAVIAGTQITLAALPSGNVVIKRPNLTSPTETTESRAR